MIKFSDFSLRRANKLLVRDLNLIIHKNDKIGLVGKNGCGKSSLLAVIRGELEADTGSVSFPEKLDIAWVQQETPALSISALEYTKQGDHQWYALQRQISSLQRQDSYADCADLYAEMEAIGGYDIDSRAARLLSGLGFEDQQFAWPVSRFSGGWRMRLNLARALICRSDVLLLDEPTNHLDLDAVIWLENRLWQYSGCLLLISHDRMFLDNLCQRIWHFNHQSIEPYSGNFSFFERARQQRQLQLKQQQQKQQQQMQHLQHFIDRFRAKATKAKQVQSRLKSLEKLQQITLMRDPASIQFEFAPPAHLPVPILKLENARLGYEQTTILEQVDFQLSAGDRIGLLGANGAGKSTLIKTLAGELQVLDGKLSRAQVKIAYFAQHQLELLEQFSSAYEYLLSFDPNAKEQQIRNFLGQFHFSSDPQANMADAPIRYFSGGEKARLVLAAMVYQKPAVLLLDEPTNHLDMDMRDALAIALQAFSGAMVIVSHDRYLLDSICDQFYLVDGAKVSLFRGNLQDYQQYVQSKSQSVTTAVKSTPQTPNKKKLRQQQAERRKQLQPLKNELKHLEQQMEQLQQQLQEIEAQMSDNRLYTADNKEHLKQLMKQQHLLQQQMQQAEERWLELSEAMEQISCQ